MSFKNTDIGLIPSEWDFDTIGDSLYIKGRIGWKGLKKSEYIDRSDYRIINGSNVVNNNIDWSGCGYISEERYEESPEIMLKPNDIVMTKDGTIGKLAIIRSLEQKTTVASGLFVIRVEDNSIDVDYLYYYFSSFYFKELVKSRIEGSVIPHLYQKDLVALKLPLPDLSEQKAISKILRTLDDKIEVNKQINKTLENMAQAIFKQWFVDFEFPNEDGEPYKSSGGEMVESELGMIPKGWEVVQIDSLCRHIKPGTNYQPKRIDLGIPFLNVRNINKGHIDVTDVKYISKEDFENVHKSWVPEENDVLISRIGTLGLVAVIRKRDLPIAVHYNFINFKTKDVSFQFFYFTLKSDFFQSQYHGIKKASVQEYVTLDEVKKLKLVFPTNREIFKNFEKKFIDMYELINNKQEETESLIKIRDSLLPKLMSGEIRVPLDSEVDVS